MADNKQGAAHKPAQRKWAPGTDIEAVVRTDIEEAARRNQVERVLHIAAWLVRAAHIVVLPVVRRKQRMQEPHIARALHRFEPVCIQPAPMHRQPVLVNRTGH